MKTVVAIYHVAFEDLDEFATLLMDMKYAMLMQQEILILN